MPAGEGVWSYPHPSLLSPLSQAVSRDCFGFCQQLGFSDPKPGLALLPASKLMPLNDASLSPGLGTSRHGGPSDRDPTHPLLGLMLGRGMFREPTVEYSWLSTSPPSQPAGSSSPTSPPPRQGKVLQVSQSSQGGALGLAGGGRLGPARGGSGCRKVGPHSQQTPWLVLSVPGLQLSALPPPSWPFTEPLQSG